MPQGCRELTDGFHRGTNGKEELTVDKNSS